VAHFPLAELSNTCLALQDGYGAPSYAHYYGAQGGYYGNSSASAVIASPITYQLQEPPPGILPRYSPVPSVRALLNLQHLLVSTFTLP